MDGELDRADGGQLTENVPETDESLSPVDGSDQPDGPEVPACDAETAEDGGEAEETQVTVLTDAFDSGSRTEPEDPKKSKKRKILMIVLIVLAALIVVLGISLLIFYVILMAVVKASTIVIQSVAEEIVTDLAEGIVRGLSDIRLFS